MQIQFNITITPIIANHLATFDHSKLHDAVSVTSNDRIAFSLSGQQLTADLTNAVKTDIAYGVTAYGYGNHSSAGYVKADGTVAFSGTVRGVTPVLGSHLATKDFVISQIHGQTWQNPVYSIKDDVPINPQLGDRYIIKGGGIWDLSLGHYANYLAEYVHNDTTNTDEWIFEAPQNGDSVKILYDDKYYTFNGTSKSWVSMGSLVAHSSLLGLGDDDHTQYHTDARGDARYSLLDHNHPGVYEPAFGFSTYLNQTVKTNSIPTFAAVKTGVIRSAVDGTFGFFKADGTGQYLWGDSTNGRIGIGGAASINAGVSLLVTGQLWTTSHVQVNGSVYSNTLNTYASGTNLQLTTGTVQNIIYTNRNLSIGTSTNTANFQVNQSTTGVGTVSNTAGGTTVTGVGTQFLNTFKVGDTITIGGQTVAISAIASDTSMTTVAITNANTNVAYTLVGGTRFQVLGNGNILVGFTSSQSSSYLFQVNGGIFSSGPARFNGITQFGNGGQGYINSAATVTILGNFSAARFDFTNSVGTFFNILSDGSLNNTIGKYFYQAASPTADTEFDRRMKNNAGVLTFERNTSAHTTKGSGGWNTDMAIAANGYVGIDTSTPQSKLDVNGGVRVGNDTDVASASKVGTIRYGKSGKATYCEICMEIGDGVFAWREILRNEW